MARELALADISFAVQALLPVEYKGVRLGCGYRVDLFVEKMDFRCVPGHYARPDAFKFTLIREPNMIMRANDSKYNKRPVKLMLRLDKMRIAFTLLFIFWPFISWAQNNLKTENVFLITLDGLRWQELFAGADPVLLNDSLYVEKPQEITKRFWAEDPITRRAILMPFFWNVIAKNGQLYGNRQQGCKVNITNNYWFSYPGYNEILVGYADDRIDSNRKIGNPNITVLEFINQQKDFKNSN